MWCIAPKANAEFVYHMEDVLAVYTRPVDVHCPVICMDETNKQLLAEVIPPLASQPGAPTRYDYEYEHAGVANLFMFYAPFEGKRRVKVTQHRTTCDWAEAMRELAEVDYPQAEKIVVVLDNLNTHSPASFYHAFPPEQARRLVERLEFHFTPKHGSWLNIAEIELSAMIRQCLAGRIANEQELDTQIQAWTADRNSRAIKVNWRFTAQDARIKLKSLYPKYDP